MQRALLQATRPENKELVQKAIRLSKRQDAKNLLPRNAFSERNNSGTKKKMTNGVKHKSYGDKKIKRIKNKRNG